MITTVLWDVDGTLLDFLAAEKAAIQSLFEEYHLGVCSDEMLKRYSSGNQFENVTENINIIRFCMMRDTSANPSYLMSAWYIKIDGVKFWCSPQDGHILAWNAEEAG